MITNDELQDMLSTVKKDEALREKLFELTAHSSDAAAIRHCISEGWYEAFDRYDSDVCEQFIAAYKKAVI